MFLFLAFGFGLIFLAHTAPFPFIIDTAERERSLWSVPDAGAPPTIYLTYDDGPNPEATPELLDVLAREGARATFFLIDRHLTEDTAPVVRRMFEEGHAVGLHSHTRALMFMTPEQLADRLTAAAGRIHELTGHEPCPIFRPHAGWRSGAMYAGLREIDYTLVGWGWMLWDWNFFREKRPADIVSRVVGRASAGDIIVLHDGHHVDPRADRQYTIEATAELIPGLRERGFELGTICAGEGPASSQTSVSRPPDPAARSALSTEMRSMISWTTAPATGGR